MSEYSALPQTHYAESDGLSIAYQVFGSGSTDLLVVPAIVSHVEANWQYEAYARFLRRLGAIFRVIIFDKRGQGLSDRFEGYPNLDDRMEDVRVVMQAALSQRAVVFASSEGGPMAALFAATYPAMVERLVLYGAMARFTKAADYPHQPSLARMLAISTETWGTIKSAPLFVPDRADDTLFCEQFASYQRQSASPSAIKRLLIANDQIDVRAILPQVRRPTLILHRRGDTVVSCANGRYLADHMPQAVYLELPGSDHFAPEGDSDAIVDAIAHFAATEWVRAPQPADQRWLATVLFTDIVGSTELAVKLGDQAWRERLQQFHALCRAQLAAQRGREIDSAGDGIFATFDGPARAIRCALAMAEQVQGIGLAIRVGLHTGEVETTGEKVSGLAVHIGARVMSHAGAGEVLVSGTVKDLVAGSGIVFTGLGAHALKGVPGQWLLHRAQLEATA